MVLGPESVLVSASQEGAWQPAGRRRLHRMRTALQAQPLPLRTASLPAGPFCLSVPKRTLEFVNPVLAWLAIILDERLL